MTDLPVVTLLLLAPLSYASYKIGRVCDVVLSGGALGAVAKGVVVSLGRFLEASLEELEKKSGKGRALLE